MAPCVVSREYHGDLNGSTAMMNGNTTGDEREYRGDERGIPW